MPQYFTPGLYYEEVDTGSNRIPNIRTDIPGFVGIAEKGPLNIAVRLTSFKQFNSIFGNFILQGYLAYAVNGFFENGGDICYVVRVADLNNAKIAELDLKNNGSIITLKLFALNEGQWGNNIKVSLFNSSIVSAVTIGNTANSSKLNSVRGFEKGSYVKFFQNGLPEYYDYVELLDNINKQMFWSGAIPLYFNLSEPIFLTSLEFSLIFIYRNETKEIFSNLSMNPDHSRYVNNIINGKSNLVITETLLPDLPDPDKLNKGLDYLKNGKDGIAKLKVDDFTGEANYSKKIGLKCFEEVDEISMVSIPDIMIQPVNIMQSPPKILDPCSPPDTSADGYKPPEFESPPDFSLDDIERMQTAMIDHCEKLKDRVAILDSPIDFNISEILDWRQKYYSQYAALYYPWIIVNDPLMINGNITRIIPPSGHIAGVFARTDLTKGVYKAPANEEILEAVDTSLNLIDSEQDLLNPESINCLRVHPGKGIIIWGARTLSSDPIWRFINIRRLLIMIEESVEESMQWAVFEPNNIFLRNGIRVAVSTFLEELWHGGALAGKTSDEAFFVKCDDGNNPQSVIDAGQLITDVGVAPAIPAEFIVFRIGKIVDEINLINEGI